MSQVAHQLFVMFFLSSSPGVVDRIETVTAEFPSLGFCQNAGEGFKQIANAKKVDVVYMCSPKGIDPKKKTVGSKGPERLTTSR